MALLWSLVVIDPLIILSTILCGCVSIVITLFDKSGNTAIGVARLWARSILWFAGVRVKIEGLEKIDPHGKHVFCSNHLSYMDTPVVLGRIPSQFRFLAKKGLFDIPLMGTHLKQAGHIPVPLDDPRAAVRTLTLAARGIQEHNTSMLIFPEGGRSDDGELQPFKDGGAYIAIKAQVPLVPMALIGTRAVLAMHSATFHPFRQVILRIGEPIPTDGLTLRNRQELTEIVRAQIVEMLARPSEP
jgi:1-acyl-sn-glycerol-3-phosphate acyltransferase